ncbi:MAG: hypothetical protein ACHQRJ_03410 [Alphaproteobacteria bacterium]
MASLLSTARRLIEGGKSPHRRQQLPRRPHHSMARGEGGDNMIASYIRTHWRGEQSLMRTTFVNGIAAYLVVIIALVALGELTTSSIVLYFGLGVFFVWWVWACVGVFRCAARAAFHRHSTLQRRIGGVAALIGVLLVSIFTLNDVIRLHLY